MTPFVSAIVLNFQSPQETVKCVQNLMKQQPIPTLHRNGEGPGVRWFEKNGDGMIKGSDWLEIIVVDNYSDDDSIGVIRNRLSGIANVRIVESPRNAGFGKGYKQGVKYADGTYLLINNPDKTLPHGGIARLVAKMEKEPDIGILAPKLMHLDGTPRLSPRRFPGPLDVVIKRTVLQKFFPNHLARYLQLREDPDRERDTDWIAGGCFLIRKDFFEELGGFDDRFFLFFEDIDLCRRCWKAGKRVVYYPQVVAIDKTRRLSEGSVLSLFTTPVGRAHVKSAFRYFGKWGWKTQR